MHDVMKPARNVKGFTTNWQRTSLGSIVTGDVECCVESAWDLFFYAWISNLGLNFSNYLILCWLWRCELVMNIVIEPRSQLKQLIGSVVSTSWRRSDLLFKNNSSSNFFWLHLFWILIQVLYSVWSLACRELWNRRILRCSMYPSHSLPAFLSCRYYYVQHTFDF